MVKRTILISILGLCCLCSPPPQSTPRSSSSDWKPNLLKGDFDSGPLQIYRDLRIVILPVTDGREDSSVIGSVRKDNVPGGEVVSLTTTKDVAQWCRSGMISALEYLGLKSAKEGELVVESELTRFFLQDEMNQRGEIDLRVSINSSGILIWEGNVKGLSELYLRPKGSDGVWECLSNTMIKTVYNLLAESSVRDAVLKSIE
ncbi:MAG: hypothetical protein GX556_12695 [Fibrobacter sp.]|nr:hypothetical protein [Fibrobacter sp.]